MRHLPVNRREQRHVKWKMQTTAENSRRARRVSLKSAAYSKKKEKNEKASADRQLDREMARL